MAFDAVILFLGIYPKNPTPRQPFSTKMFTTVIYNSKTWGKSQMINNTATVKF